MSDDKHELTREQQEKRAAENRQRKERAARARSQLTLAMAKIEPVLALARHVAGLLPDDYTRRKFWNALRHKAGKEMFIGLSPEERTRRQETALRDARAEKLRLNKVDEETP